MHFRYFPEMILVVVFSLLTAGCQNPNLALLKDRSVMALKSEKVFNVIGNLDKDDGGNTEAKPLNEILNGSLADRNSGTDFVTTVFSALQKDPIVVAQRQTVTAKLAAIDFSEARKEYEVTSTVYGGIEDITDNTTGIALSLRASKLIFDGGMVDAEIAFKQFEAEAAELNLQATLDKRANILGEIWIELEKYESLQKQINQRLAVLDPLIDQLEQVAKAGIGDVSKVTAAQRTVSGIRVIQTNVSEGLAKAKLEFLNVYGSVDENISYDARFIRDLLPDKLHNGLAKQSPLLRAKYATYKASLANLKAKTAKDNFNVGFEARAMRPFVGSEYDSDESLGLVARKTLYNGGMLESEIEEAEALAQAALAEVESAYRQGVRLVAKAKQSIESMDKAIELARDNAQITSDEIVYLRQQLIIGGSTLDSVLSAEARLYEAETKEIEFLAEKRRAELGIATTLGLLGPAFSSQ